MNARTLLLSGAIALASANVFAGDFAGDPGRDALPLSRAQVAAQTSEARAHNDLVPAGQLPSNTRSFAPSEWSRAAVRAQTRQALASGSVQPAGQLEYVSVTYPASTLSRAEVKADVFAARAAGKLTPAGERYGNVEFGYSPSLVGANPFGPLARFARGFLRSDTSTQ